MQKLRLKVNFNYFLWKKNDKIGWYFLKTCFYIFYGLVITAIVGRNLVPWYTTLMIL